MSKKNKLNRAGCQTFDRLPIRIQEQALEWIAAGNGARSTLYLLQRIYSGPLTLPSERTLDSIIERERAEVDTKAGAEPNVTPLLNAALSRERMASMGAVKALVSQVLDADQAYKFFDDYCRIASNAFTNGLEEIAEVAEELGVVVDFQPAAATIPALSTGVVHNKNSAENEEDAYA